MQPRKWLDIILTVWKILLLVLLAAAIVTVFFHTLRNLPSDIACKNDPDCRGAGVGNALFWLLSLGWNIACAVLALIGWIVSKLCRSTPNEKKNRKHFCLLLWGALLGQVLITAETLICLAIINKA